MSERAPRGAWRFALASLLGLATAGLAASGASAASSASPLFALSPIAAVSLAAPAATRFTVTVSHAPLDNSPAFSWRLNLTRGDRVPACENERLPGARRLGPGEFVWASQTSNFVWYRGAAQTCKATIIVVAENEYAHCTASVVAGTGTANPLAGPPAVCGLGGFSLASSTLPVPAALLDTYARLSGALTRLLRALGEGKPLGSAQLATRLAPLLKRQTSTVANLYPPVWGCAFATLFNPFVRLQGAFDAQIAELRAGVALPGSILSEDAAGLRTASLGLRSCGRSAENHAGAPESVLKAGANLALAASLLSHTGPSSGRGAARSLATLLERLEGTLDATLRTRFPVVFGIAYGDLVSQVASEDVAIAQAERFAQSGNAHAEAIALVQAAGPAGAISQGLVRHQKRVIVVENAKS